MAVCRTTGGTPVGDACPKRSGGGDTHDGTQFANSGVPSQYPQPATYSLTFTKPGRYQYVCTIHGPGMGGVITIGERASSTPAAVRGQARAEQAATITAGQAAFAAIEVERAGGAVTVSRGTAVTWAMRDPFEIHTITFTSGQKPPDFIIPEPQAQGPPKVLMNPKAAVPTMTKTYAGTGYLNSGILFPPGLPGNPPTSYSLTFTKAGRDEYWCIVHVPGG